ncbi:hypothetical protein [Vibrio alginolyticus]|uniref:hypothetical protein n=1 Tax=Vibrio alginolyticus TaxID=663 RepID=UPI0010429D5E|nr:hypothetical protein [Vibrio alginolyticus]MCZ2800783.1 hypothetical protein [Vibrio alginolyticus]TDE49425.1 hypothetical protein E1093_09365 [Vibrio alginolyticus]
MLTAAANKTENINVDNAIKRIQIHVSKSRSSFGKALNRHSAPNYLINYVTPITYRVVRSFNVGYTS